VRSVKDLLAQLLTENFLAYKTAEVAQLLFPAGCFFFAVALIFATVLSESVFSPAYERLFFPLV